MFYIDPIDDGSDMNLTEDERNKMELRVLEEETKNAAVAKEYLANKKKPFYHPEHYYEMSAFKFDVKKRRAIEPTSVKNGPTPASQNGENRPLQVINISKDAQR